MFFSLAAHAQENVRKSGDLYKSLSVNVDAELDEWTELLTPVGNEEDTAWFYAVAFDTENLYIAMQIKDKILQQEAVRGGFLVNINTKNKKQDGSLLLFPVPDRELVKEFTNENKNQNKDARAALIDFARGYQIKGFDRLLDGLLSLENTYGLKAKVKIGDDDELNYEAKIPLSTLALSNSNQAIAIRVGVNTRWMQIQRIRNNSRRGQGGSIQNVKNPYDFDIDVWLQGEID